MTAEKKVYTIREQIADHIRSDILTGVMKEGDKLLEQGLSERFGVSRGPVRDVLLQLTQEGLLDSKPNCGVRVSAVDEWIQPLLVDLRLHIELFALEHAFHAFDEKALQEMEAHVEHLHAACKEGNLRSVVSYDVAFHRTILLQTGNERIVDVWKPIMQRMMLNYDRLEDLMVSYREHKAILDAIRAKDLKRAKKALKQNVL